MSDKKVCEVCGREKWAYSGPARNPDNCMIEFKWCPPADAAKHWKLGYEREKAKAAILTPEVLRLIKAVREVTPFEWELQAAIRQVRALPLENLAEPNHTAKQQLPKKGGE